MSEQYDYQSFEDFLAEEDVPTEDTDQEPLSFDDFLAEDDPSAEESAYDYQSFEDFLASEDPQEEVLPEENILEQNRGKNFVDRMFDPTPPVINNPDGSISTHIMTDAEVDSGDGSGRGKFIVYPTVIQKEEGAELIKVSAQEAQQYALETGEFIEFDTQEEATAFSTNGYKQLAPKGAFTGEPYDAPERVSSIDPRPSWAQQQGLSEEEIEPASVTELSEDAQLGVKNNNWLNITQDDDNDWIGQSGDDGKFVTFKDPVYGVRAADRLIENYHSKRGIDTISGVISRFAPSEENPTDSYIDFVSGATGIPRDQSIDLADPEVRGEVLKAMVAFETPEIGRAHV